MKSILFLGDVFLPKAFDFQVNLSPDDNIILNLEYAITEAQQGHPAKVNLKAERNYITETFPLPPLAVSLSNNHVADYGARGLNETIESLKRMNVHFFGAGTLEDNCHNPLLLDIDGCLLGIMGYVCPTVYPVFASENRCGVMPDELDIICRDINTARQSGAGQVVVVLHWGFEDVFLPRPQDIELAHRIIDNGADLIIGHHAHCIQPYEVYNGKYIFYGLGNCIMPDLSVPSYFTAEGIPTMVYTKRQKWWHRHSLGVRYLAHSGEMEVFGLHFDGNTLAETGRSVEKYRLKMSSRAVYQKRFDAEYFISSLRKMIANFLMDPKLPSFRHLKSIFSHAQKVVSSRR